MGELYPGIPGSPITYLAGDISAGQTTIAIADDTALPDAPNLCTIGFGENIETIRYGAKSNGVLSDVTRGIEGTPRAWQAGTEVARFFTAHDHITIIDKITENANNLATHQADNAAHSRYDNIYYRTLGGGDQSIPNDTITNVEFSTTSKDSNAFSYNSQTGGITVVDPNVKAVRVYVNISWISGSTSGYRMVRIALNGSYLPGGMGVSQIGLSSTGGACDNKMPQQNIVALIPVNTNDTIAVQVRQNSGGSRSLANGRCSIALEAIY